MADEIIRETISVTRTSISEEDKAVAAKYHKVVTKGLEYADWILSWGTPSEKMRIATAAMSSAARLAAVDSKAEIEEHRLELERMMDEMADVAEQEVVVAGPEAPPTFDFIDAKAQTLAIRPHDQD